MRTRVLCAIGMAGLLAAPALAQERSPDERQTLVALAYVIGQSHGLRQVCAVNDQYWRGRMQQLEAAEQPDAPFDKRLRDAFNGGYAAARAAYPACNGASRHAAKAIAAKGKDLAANLSDAVADDTPAR